MLRFACRPNGDMTIDDLRIALINFIVAKQRKEEFIVRIDDRDKENIIEGKDQEILEILALFGIEYSQLLYQSQHNRFYSAMALQLLHEKKAFNCFCSHEYLEKKREEAKQNNQAYRYDDACENLPAELVIDNTNPFAVRIKKPQNSKDLDSFLILTQEKIPTNTFASAIDDMLSDISLIVCSKEEQNDTLKQEHIRESLGYDKSVEFVYLTPFKSGVSVTSLLKDGILPSAILNYLISTTINPPKEIFTLQEAIEWFDLNKISESPTCFDINTLLDLNREHLKKLDNKELSRYVGFADEEIGALAKTYLKEVHTTKELRSKIEPIFQSKTIPQEFSKMADVMRKVIKSAPYFDTYDDFKAYVIKESALSEEDFMQTLHILFTGAKDGSDVVLIYQHLKNYIGEII